MSIYVFVNLPVTMITKMESMCSLWISINKNTCISTYILNEKLISQIAKLKERLCDFLTRKGFQLEENKEIQTISFLSSVYNSLIKTRSFRELKLFYDSRSGLSTFHSRSTSQAVRYSFFWMWE